MRCNRSWRIDVRTPEQHTKKQPREDTQQIDRCDVIPTDHGRAIPYRSQTHKLLLLHEHVVGAVVDNTLAEHRGGKVSVRLLSRDVGDLASEREVVSLRAKRNGHAATKHDESEDISVLVAAVKEELVRVHTVRRRRAEPRDDVEDNGGKRRVLGKELSVSMHIASCCCRSVS